MSRSRYHIPDEETLDPIGLRALQHAKLAALLREVLPHNRFYQAKYQPLKISSETPLEHLPFLARAEIEQDQANHPPYGANLTYPLSQYTRFHQTSGSAGRPVRWLDTPQSWQWLQRCWGIIFRAIGIEPADRFIFTFSFGPFIGFWAAFESAAALGHLSIPAGGLSTGARLRMILDNQVTVICCTPTYALRMSETAAENNIDLRGSAVRALIVAGEPGGNIPATRQRIEQSFNARVFDHTGMTEIGSLGIECLENPGGVHILESECIPEVIDPQTQKPAAEGQLGELVITNLGRLGSPVIRYRTGDLVRMTRKLCPCGRCFARLEGGILGRVDDMFIIRGNNVFPSAMESIIRRFAEVAEYRVEVYDEGGLAQVAIELEPHPSANGEDLACRVGQAIADALSFRAEIRTVSPGVLPRFEMKARRFTRRSNKTENSSPRAQS
ncbi:MAG TPA: AMP-binding protein [Tepidisphaeraceae bacterium]|jgi:phenylacetate-CoA ligase|nr:AMP-binding protein [Tepidisphaeraceae bacterium]HEV8604075.1 AMP-binding protein [Tepidisphaeraceae bacterium]